MRKLVGVLVVVLLAVGSVLAVSPAGASVAGRNAKFCKVWSKVGSSGPSSTSSVGAQAKAVAKDFRKAAKTVPGGTAKALNTAAGFYEKLGKLKSERDVPKFALANSGQYQKFLKSITTITTYVVKNCTA